MKHLTLLFILSLISGRSFSQNDSLFTNVYAEMQVYAVQTDAIAPDYESYEAFNFDSGNGFDTIYLGNPVSYSAMLFFDDYKVYIQGGPINQYANTYSDSAFVLYDFSLEVGDTAYSRESWAGTDYITVTDVEYEFIEGRNRKKIYLTEDIWIQGLGSVSHPFYPIVDNFEISHTVCYAEMSYMGQNGSSNFSYLGSCPQPTNSLTEEINEDKQLLKVVDFLGRETKLKSNEVQIYVYSDGTIEKMYLTD